MGFLLEQWKTRLEYNDHVQIRFGDVKHSLPGVEPFGGECLEILREAKALQSFAERGHEEYQFVNAR
jgi:hypothetical protein